MRSTASHPNVALEMAALLKVDTLYARDRRLIAQHPTVLPEDNLSFEHTCFHMLLIIPRRVQPHAQPSSLVTKYYAVVHLIELQGHIVKLLIDEFT